MTAQAQEKPAEILEPTTTGTDLITVENLTPADIFTGDKITEFLNMVKGHIDAFKGDASTEAGREEIKSFAFKIRKSKTLIEKIGDDYARFLKDEPKRVDKERKRWKDTLEAWADAVRKPVTDIEDADKARKDAHQALIDKIGQALTFTAPPVTANVAERIAWVETQKTRAWDEFANLAESTIKAVIESLQETHAKAKKSDDDAAELERLRKAEADRIEAERIKKIETDAAEKARTDLLAEQAAAAAKPAETVSEVLDSLPPVTEPAPAATPAPAHMAADGVTPAPANGGTFAKGHPANVPATGTMPPEVEHKARILREVLASLLSYGTTEAGARALIAEILKGKIAHVTINFGG